MAVKARDRSTLRSIGPCIICRTPTKYGNGDGNGLAGAHVSFGDDWLDKHIRYFARRGKPFVFANWTDQRKMGAAGVAVYYRISPHDHAGGGITKVGNLSCRAIQPYLCSTCLSELESGVQERLAVAQSAHAEALERQRYEDTIRKPISGEFFIERGTQEFRLVFSEQSVHHLKVQWRTSTRYCVGSRPAFVILLSVNGRLRGRDRVPNVDGKTSVEQLDSAVARLIAKWANRSLQKELAIARADVMWNPLETMELGTVFGHDSPRLVRTRWIDGNTHTTLTGIESLDDVASLLGIAGCVIT